MGHHPRAHNAKLHLVGPQLLLQAGLEQLQLAGAEVAHPKVEHLALALQLLEGLGHLFRLHEGVGPVEQQKVHVVGAQAPQAALHALQDVLLGEVVPIRADAALGLQDQLLPQAGLQGQGLAKAGFALSPAVDVRVVKKVDALFQGGVDVLQNGLGLHAVHAHAAHANGRAQHAAAANIQLLHGGSSLCETIYP